MTALAVFRMSLGAWAFEQVVQETAAEARRERALTEAPMGDQGIDPIGLVTVLQLMQYVES